MEATELTEQITPSSGELTQPIRGDFLLVSVTDSKIGTDEFGMPLVAIGIKNVPVYLSDKEGNRLPDEDGGLLAKVKTNMSGVAELKIERQQYNSNPNLYITIEDPTGYSFTQPKFTQKSSSFKVDLQKPTVTNKLYQSFKRSKNRKMIVGGIIVVLGIVGFYVYKKYKK